MSEENGKVVGMNNGAADENGGTEGIKGTDYIEPKGKVRKVLKWVLSGLALIATGVIGGLIGHNIGKDDDDDKTEETGSNETTTEG